MSYWPSLFFIRGFVETKAKDLLPSLEEIPNKSFLFEFAENRAAEVLVRLRHKYKEDPYYIKELFFTISWATHWEDVSTMEHCIKNAIVLWWEEFHDKNIFSDNMPEHPFKLPSESLRSIRTYSAYHGNKMLEQLNTVSGAQFDVHFTDKDYGHDCIYSCPTVYPIMRVRYYFINGDICEVNWMRNYLRNVCANLPEYSNLLNKLPCNVLPNQCCWLIIFGIL